MKLKISYIIVMLVLITFSSPVLKAGELELEAIPFLYAMDGYHLALGYRAENMRYRASCLQSAGYDAEKSGINNSSPTFERFYDHGSCGVFIGYFLTENFHIYVFAEQHNWIINNTTNQQTAKMTTIDKGPGLGYQWFIGQNIYLQPAFHLYYRDRQKILVGGQDYLIPSTDAAFVLRAGYQF